MANSKYEYVKCFEADTKLLPNTYIVVRIDGHHFHHFAEKNEFEKPNDVQALRLMNSCAVALLEEYPHIIFAYGVSDEYSFIFKRSSDIYERRASKILSLVVSYFSTSYVMKWNEFFPGKMLRTTPSFDSRAVCLPSMLDLRNYLAWRQVDCHINNQYNTCFWMLIKSGKTKQEAQALLKGTQTQEKNELLFQQFDINYDRLPAIFRKGSCVFKEKAEEVVKHTENGDPVKRLKNRLVVEHCDIIQERFWKEHPEILGS